MSDAFISSCKIAKAKRRWRYRYPILALCVAAAVSLSLIQSSAAKSKIPFAGVSPFCPLQCFASRGSGISCPHFLDTAEYHADYPECVSYSMQWTASCGWRLRRVFMCR